MGAGNLRKLLFFFTLILSNVLAEIDVVAELGATHVELLQQKGAPNAILPVRQERPDDDDVAFVYGESYFYLYNNHFYRAFFSKRHSGEIYKGLKIGDSKGELTKLWGNKYDLEKDGLVWQKDGYIIVAKITTENRLESIWFIKDAN
ncbi:MAG: hypothetical protein LBL50_01485 [Candidatus Margulisbacteria bacterium]|jgi:hypothetical protein|nr:hypothetical protein [Candidatus Margulisiibacteriota bacterium]